MKRFRSSVQRLLRVKEQTERLKQLNVSRARIEVDASTSRLLIAQAAEATQLQELTTRLTQPGRPLTLEQTNVSYLERREQTSAAHDEQANSQTQFDESLYEHRIARQQRELVERVLTHQREEHRRHALRTATVELQEWALRRTPETHVITTEEGPDA